jgi:hypothetical protein
MGEMRNMYKILIGKPDEIRSPERQRPRWQNNIKSGLKEIVYEGVD